MNSLKFKLNTLFFFFLLLLVQRTCFAATPARCRKEQIEGNWTFYVNREVFNPELNNNQTSCGHGFPNHIDQTYFDFKDFEFKESYGIRLEMGADYRVYDLESKNDVGFWTPVYDGGFILKYNNTVFTASSKYYMVHHYFSVDHYVSNCDKTMIGWVVHDQTTPEKNWSCFYGLKDKSEKHVYKGIKPTQFMQQHTEDFYLLPNQSNIENSTSTINVTSNSIATNKTAKIKYEENEHFVKEINKLKLTWKAGMSDYFNGTDINNLTEYAKSHIVSKAKISKKGLNKKYMLKNHLNLLEISSKQKPKKSFTDGFFGLNTSFEGLSMEDKKLSKRSKLKNMFSEMRMSSLATKYLNHELDEIDESELPKSWDWRNVEGKNYLPKVGKQYRCGACYIFSTLASLESRLRIMTNLQDKTTFSRQFFVSCGFYTEGCQGGYPILVGKFANEFELIQDSCMEYTAVDTSCTKICNYKRYMKKYTVSRYEYLGGYYGATSELLMMKEIRARGPIPGSFKHNAGFKYYKSGIYTESSFNTPNSGKISSETMSDRNKTFETISHSILIVGWGEENGIKYWICMNSWGENWGENGYFKLVRGENDGNIESMGDAMRIKVEDRKVFF